MISGACLRTFRPLIVVVSFFVADELPPNGNFESGDTGWQLA